MRKATFTLFFIMAFAVSGCGAPVAPTQPPADTATSASPTLTPSPLPIAIEVPATSTLTPEPGLRTSGPYFAYFRYGPDHSDYQFVLMDADGGGKKVVDLPDEIVDSLSKANYQLGARHVSPDGKWLAFYTGYAGEVYTGSTQSTASTFDLTLKLMNFETGEIQIVSPLLSKDYPENFAKAMPEFDEYSHLRPEDLQNAFLFGITQALAWSPDGRYLAFAGQMEGLSSDLYLYDMTTKKIQRKSNDIEELQLISWSPDGKWILHGSKTASVDPWVEYSIYAVALDDSSIRNLGSGLIGNWLNAHEILEYRSGIEKYQLSLVDLDTGNITEIWEGYFGGYQVDPTGNWVVLDAISSTIPPKEEKPGFIYGSIQLINLNTLETIQNPSLLAEPLDAFLRAKDGTVFSLPHRIGILPSPDQKYWVVVIGRDIKIYTQDLNSFMEVSSPFQDTNIYDVPWSPDDMQWSPDSSNLFLIYSTNVYHINISNGEINLVETNLPSTYWLDSGWINGQ